MQPSQWFSIERVVTLLTPLFAAGAAWLSGWITTLVPGIPHITASAIEGVEIAAFISTCGVVIKWLHGRQIPAIAGIAPSQSEIDRLHAELEAYLAAHPPTVTPGGPTASDLRALVQQELRNLLHGASQPVAPAPGQ